jgi:hypothetical protein
MKKALLSSLVVMSTLFAPVNVFAYENFNYEEFINDVKIETEERKITISWSEIPGAVEYKIYQGESEVYSGTKVNFTHDNLEPGKPYKYNLIAVDSEGESIANIILKTKTNESEGLSANSSSRFPIKEVNVSTISNGEYIKFDWNDISQIEEYDVIKNGELIESINESVFNDKLDGKKERIVYEFLGKIPVDEQEKKIRLSQIEENLGEIGSDNKNTEDLLYDYVSIIKIIDKKKYETDSVSINADDGGDSVDNVKIRYTTFIADRYVENPVPYALRLTGDDWEEEVEYFGGDNRDFAVVHSRYRTQINIEADFTDEDIDLDKDVGTSKFYDENKNLIQTAKASASGIKMISDDITQDEAYFRIDHEVGIPYLEDSDEFTPPAIDYEFTAYLYREDGEFEIDGWHDGAPSHEMYISFDDYAYDELFTHDLYDFWYLFSVTPKYYFDISN